MRILAIDWSGAKAGERSKIWLAEAQRGALVRLESGRSREEVVSHVIEAASRNPELVVGIDFAFSMPHWFLEELDVTGAESLWATVARLGEDWLSGCEPPFWGRPGRRKPTLPEHFRRTEQAASEPAGSIPKSVFQIGGAGAVATGSIRGMPYLAELRRAGFSVWPFHVASPPLAIEIYPRLLTGPVKKSNQVAREAYLAEGLPEIDDTLRPIAASSEDAFDAAVSAVIMARHADELSRLPAAEDEVERMEGRIWWPQRPRSAPLGVAAAPHARRAPADCPFCRIDAAQVIEESRHAIAVRDRYPVNEGHTLVIPKAHVDSIFDLDRKVQQEVWHLVARVRETLGTVLHPHGFNVGVNDGHAAGQTVAHAHVHVIPRFEGDVQDPRGGIRWVRPERARYWDE